MSLDQAIPVGASEVKTGTAQFPGVPGGFAPGQGGDQQPAATGTFTGFQQAGMTSQPSGAFTGFQQAGSGLGLQAGQQAGQSGQAGAFTGFQQAGQQPAQSGQSGAAFAGFQPVSQQQPTQAGQAGAFTGFQQAGQPTQVGLGLQTGQQTQAPTVVQQQGDTGLLQMSQSLGIVSAPRGFVTTAGNIPAVMDLTNIKTTAAETKGFAGTDTSQRGRSDIVGDIAGAGRGDTRDVKRGAGFEAGAIVRSETTVSETRYGRSIGKVPMPTEDDVKASKLNPMRPVLIPVTSKVLHPVTGDVVTDQPVIINCDNIDIASIAKMSLDDLRRNLSANGRPVYGKKEDLVNRLQNYCRQARMSQAVASSS